MTINIITEKRPPLSLEKRKKTVNQHMQIEESPIIMAQSVYESVNMPVYESKTDSRINSNTIS